MPRFHFHLRSLNGLIEDEEGYDLPDMEAVKAEVAQDAREMAANAIRAGQPIGERQFEVMNDAGEVVMIYPLSDAIRFS